MKKTFKGAGRPVLVTCKKECSTGAIIRVSSGIRGTLFYSNHSLQEDGGLTSSSYFLLRLVKSSFSKLHNKNTNIYTIIKLNFTNMNTIIALIWNQQDVYNRHWVRNCGEEKSAFISRIKKCYSQNPNMVVEFYEGKEIN